MNKVVLSVVGVAVAGLPLGEVSARTAAELRCLLAEHGVLIMPGQEVDDAGFVAFLCSPWGAYITGAVHHVDGGRLASLL